MKFFTTAFLFFAFAELIVMPAKIRADDHEQYTYCTAHCQVDCATRNAGPLPCPLICKPGKICVDGYVRRTQDGPCILPSECP